MTKDTFLCCKRSLVHIALHVNPSTKRAQPQYFYVFGCNLSTQYSKLPNTEVTAEKKKNSGHRTQ